MGRKSQLATKAAKNTIKFYGAVCKHSFYFGRYGPNYQEQLREKKIKELRDLREIQQLTDEITRSSSHRNRRGGF